MRLAEVSLPLAILAGFLSVLVLLAVIIPPVVDISSCLEINSSGTYNVTADITGATIDADPLGGKACIKIAASNVILECNGYSITEGGVGGATYGVLLNGSVTNVTIRNCPNISDYRYGIYVYQSDGNNFTNTSTISNDRDGFCLDGSDNNIFTDINSFDNGWDGISLDQSNSNNFTDTNSSNNDDGVLLQNSDNNIFADCNFFDNSKDGISLDQSNDNYLTCIVSYNNSHDGFYLDSSSNNALTNNTARNNSKEGVELTSSNSSTLTDNKVYGNDNGIYLYLSLNNTLTNNTVYDNDNGIELDSSSNNNITDSTLYNNSYGVYITASENNQFINNTAWDSFFNGFYLEGADSSSFVDNTVYDNTDGFNIRSCSFSNFTGNTVYDNDNAFILEDCNDSNLINNTAYSNLEAAYLLDSNASITGDHYYNNTYGLGVEGTGVTITLTGVVFDNPAGNLTNYTNLSLNDAVASAYGINYATSPAPLPPGSQSFRGKFIEIINKTENVSLDSVVWHWQENETANYTESWLKLWKHNASGWTMLSATLNTAANTLTVTNLDEFSTFAILVTPPPEDDDGDGKKDKPLSVSFESTCDGNVVTVTSNDNPLEGAKVVVKDTALLEVYTTDINGEVVFPGYGLTVDIIVSKDGYAGASMTETLIDPGQCAPVCTDDADCPDNQHCEDGECVAVECPCGVVEDHLCKEYECCEDADCPEGQACVDNRCQLLPVYGCTSDADCAETEFCDIPEGEEGGLCEPVTGCGVIVDHTLVPYECGDAPECPPCPQDSVCVSHKCVVGEIEGPGEGVVGDIIILNIRENGQRCAGCIVEITDPGGRKSMDITDAEGNLELLLNTEGEYTVTLLMDGKPAATMSVTALAGAPPPGEVTQPGVGLFTFFVLVVLVALGLLAFYLLKKRGGRRKGYSFHR